MGTVESVNEESEGDQNEGNETGVGGDGKDGARLERDGEREEREKGCDGGSAAEDQARSGEEAKVTAAAPLGIGVAAATTGVIE